VGSIPIRSRSVVTVDSSLAFLPTSQHESPPFKMTKILEEWDAGAMGCGELILELKRRLSALPPGATLKLIAHDPGVPEDLPAWSRMTGNQLVWSSPPEYLIERKSQ
jgi:tRNA 2-thiouridine synthesizing protein A